MLKKNKTSKKIKASSRRKFFKAAIATTTVAASLTMPNVALGAPVTLKMQAAWNGGKNIFFEMAKDYEKRVNQMAGGTMKLEVLPRGAIAKAEEIADQETVVQLEKKMLGNEFNLEDFQQQLTQLKKMGSLQQIMGMMPGLNRKLLKGMDMDDRQLSWTAAIINSMTPAERKKPNLIDGSRRKRIAEGSGRSLQEVNQLLKQFVQMKKMMKQFGKMKPGKMPLGNFMGIS